MLSTVIGLSSVASYGDIFVPTDGNKPAINLKHAVDVDDSGPRLTNVNMASGASNQAFAVGNVDDGDRVASTQLISAPTLCPEVLHEVFKHAMTASPDAKIVFIGGTDQLFKSDVAVGLVKVSHEVHHEAIAHFFRENTFFADSSESYEKLLNFLAKPSTYSTCPRNGCQVKGYPVVKKLEFNIGSEQEPMEGSEITNSFAEILDALPNAVHTAELHLHFQPYWFPGDEMMPDFYRALEKLRSREA